jgi:hypothetical protein
VAQATQRADMDRQERQFQHQRQMDITEAAHQRQMDQAELALKARDLQQQQRLERQQQLQQAAAGAQAAHAERLARRRSLKPMT